MAASRPRQAEEGGQVADGVEEGEGSVGGELLARRDAAEDGDEGDAGAEGVLGVDGGVADVGGALGAGAEALDGEKEAARVGLEVGDLLGAEHDGEVVEQVIAAQDGLDAGAQLLADDADAYPVSWAE